MISINDETSTPIQLLAGIPQGAILSPMVFNAWVADIPQPEGVSTKISQFADDISTWTIDKNMRKAEQKLQRFNNRLVAWSKTWRIRLSPAKTQVIKFHHKRISKNSRSPGQTIDGKRIPASDEVEFLGLRFDKKMSFKKQAQKTQLELNRRLKIFAGITGSTTKPRAPTWISQQIFQSMIIPVMTYGSAATCIRTDSGLDKQDILLRKAARLAIHAPHSTRNDYLDRTIGLETSKALLKRLAKQYIMSDKRAESIKTMVRVRASRTGLQNGKSTPLDIILSNQS